MSEPIVFVWNPRLEDGPIVSVEPENADGPVPVISCSGFTKGAIVQEVRAAILRSTQIIPDRPTNDSQAARLLRVEDTDEEIIYSWHFGLDKTVDGDNRLAVREGYDNRLVVWALFAGIGWKLATTANQIFVGTLPKTTFRHKVNIPSHGQQYPPPPLTFTSGSYQLPVSGEATLGLINVIMTQITQTPVSPSTSSSGWTTKSYGGARSYKDQITPGAKLGKNYLWVVGVGIGGLKGEPVFNSWPVEFDVS
jgi:hypothetical protein